MSEELRIILVAKSVFESQRVKVASVLSVVSFELILVVVDVLSLSMPSYALLVLDLV